LQSGFKEAIEQRSQVANALKQQKYQEIGKYLPEGDYETPNLARVAQEVLDRERNSLAPNKELINLSRRILERKNPTMSEELQFVTSFEKGSPAQRRAMENLGITDDMLSESMEGQKPRDWSTLQNFRSELND
jgi:hypothetical protein